MKARPQRFWAREIETLNRRALEQLQLKRLQETVRRVARRVPFYQQNSIESGLKPEAVKVADKPGALHAITERLAKQRINVENSAGFVTQTHKKAGLLLSNSHLGGAPICNRL